MEPGDSNFATNSGSETKSRKRDYEEVTIQWLKEPTPAAELKRSKQNDEAPPKSNESSSHFQLVKEFSFYINHLKNYPKDCLRPNTLNFRQMLFRDLLKGSNQNPERDLQVAFMTTFGYEMDLLEPILKAKCHLTIANDMDQNYRGPMVQKGYYGYPNCTLIYPPKDASRNFMGAFHPKLWLLKFPEFLRVVISSGNLTVGDWTVWSNCMWIHDCKPKKKGEEAKKRSEEESKEFDRDKDFEEYLKFYVQAIMPKGNKYQELLKIDLDDYVFENIDIVLVGSLPGRFMGKEMLRYGHPRLLDVLGHPSHRMTNQGKPKVLVYQTTSIGALSPDYFKEFLASLRVNGWKVTDCIKGRGKAAKAGGAEAAALLNKSVYVIYPTKSYIQEESIGPEFSGCLLLASKNWDKDTFPKKSFSKYEGKEDYAFSHGAIPHLKVFVVCNEDFSVDDDTIIYYGSHNFSPAAWGKYEKDCTQTNIYNSELGVLHPPRVGSKSMKEKIIGDLPFRFPPRRYETSDSPWIRDKVGVHEFEE
eukprot:TRINITY_DN2604_c0_g2_i1.p1 TRINITY_DN2604_c0_g2~~TRINITY_DN2604_c0_g2_i1.p1  ORF type:complete len:530 (-),score=122.28 TRINITY_DN2604_c0_g2_i1:115-1704(-)